MYKDLSNEFTRVAYVRKEIESVNYHRSDPDRLRKFKDLFLEYFKSFKITLIVGTINCS